MQDKVRLRCSDWRKLLSRLKGYDMCDHNLRFRFRTL